jgi:hypothetical protein
MDIFPVVAPTGTVVEILVLVDETTVAATPLKVIVFDAAVSLKPVPLIVTAVPTFPDVGEKLVMANCGGDSSSSQEIKNKAKKKMLPVTRSPIAISRKYSTGEIFLSITGVFYVQNSGFWQVCAWRYGAKAWNLETDAGLPAEV